MKQTNYTIRVIAALFLMGTVFTGCSDELWTQDNYEGTYTLSVETSKGVSVTTRALTQSGSTITASWATTDHIYVKKGETWASGSLQPKTAGATSTLRGSLSGVSIAANDELTLQFPKSGTLDYTGQKGTLADIAANYDYATAAATVTSVNNGIVTATANTFTNQQAIVKFTLLDKGNSDAALNPSSLTLSDGTNTVSLTDIPATTYTANEATNVLYTAFPAAGTAKNITLTATVNDDHYFYEKPDVTFTNGNYYDITVKMAYDYRHVPLTFEAKEAGAEVTFTINGVATNPVQYSTDGSTWENYSSGTAITLTNVGDKVSFRGDNAAYATNFSNYSKLSCNKDCYIYGNVMSLVSSTDYANTTTLTAGYAFFRLFEGNAQILNHPSKTLVLPATTLAGNCYQYMFQGCTSLTTAPELPATTLANNCYQSMFYGCTSLATAPELPATTLASKCYQHMFNGCTSLATAPELPATTLANNCYSVMFHGCTSLTTAPALPATTLADYCYQQMFQGCTSLTTAPALPATTLTNNCYSVMFSNCTSLTTAPELPATTLANYCYQQMFQGCTILATAPVLPATTLTPNCYYLMFDGCSNLNSVTCLATDISASLCTQYWLRGVAAGTFYKNPSMSSWIPNSDNGIPSGWTVIDAVIDLSTVKTDITVPNGWIITGTLGENHKISIAAGAIVTLSDANINGSETWSSGNYAGLNCLGDATIILEDGTTNNVKGFYKQYPGIHIPSGYTLTINGTGALNASTTNKDESYSGGAGIGGGQGINCGNIIINGGTVTATGGKEAAGIGSGRVYTSCGNIIINGGTVTAYGGFAGAGIGCGALSSCGAITIRGGSIYAMGGDCGAGIGCGVNHTSCGDISITGGTVEARGGNSAAGIGSGENTSSCGAIRISGGTVDVTGGRLAAGIGSGWKSSCGAITIASTVTRVTATKGELANTIGAGYKGSCGTVTIGGIVGAISTSPYTYQP